jgi:hypothetical protein
MEDADSPKWVGKPVRDIYGRKLGRVIGITFDLGGKMESVGVETAGVLVDVHPDQITSVREELVIVPKWKLECRFVGLERGGLKRRLSALTQMVNEKRISQQLSKDILAELSSIQKSHEVVTAKTEAKMQDLERADKSIDDFLSLVTLQHLAGEMSNEEYEFTLGQFESMKAMNGREILDIRRALGEQGEKGDEHMTIRRDRFAQSPGNGEQSEGERLQPMRDAPVMGVPATSYPDLNSPGTEGQASAKGSRIDETTEHHANPLLRNHRPGIQELDLQVPAERVPVGATRHEEGLGPQPRPRRPDSGERNPSSTQQELSPKATLPTKNGIPSATEQMQPPTGQEDKGEPILSRQVSEWVFAKIVDLEALDIKAGDYKPLKSLER